MQRREILSHFKVTTLITLLLSFAIAGCNDSNNSNEDGADKQTQQTQKSPPQKADSEDTNNSIGSTNTNSDASEKEKLPPLSSLWLTVNSEAELSLLLGIFYQEKLARNFLARIKKLEIDAALLKMINASEEHVFIVLTGKFRTRKLAEVEQSRLKSHFGIRTKAVNFLEEK